MTILNKQLTSTEVEEALPVDISDWKDVGLTVSLDDAAGGVGTVQGSRGMGAITDKWEDLMAYSDDPIQIPNSIRRLRLKTTAIDPDETVVAEAVGNY
jgi:hypothetical protein